MTNSSSSSSVVLNMFMEDEEDDRDYYPYYSSDMYSSPGIDSPPQPLFSNLLTDVSESSSDDDLINKLSHDLELPLALNDMEPVSAWSAKSVDIFQEFNVDNLDTLDNSIKSEDEFTVDDFTHAFYPNLSAGIDQDIDVHKESPPVHHVSKVQHVKQEPSSPRRFLQMPPTPDDSHDIWELLCATDIKPNVKALDTPPVTPPQSESSPPHSPTPSPVSPLSSTVVLSPPHNQQKRYKETSSTNPMTQPIKVVTITTRNGANGPGATKGGRITKTMKIQPKVVTTTTTQPPVINIINPSSAPKLALPKTVAPRSVPSGGARIVQLKAPPVATSVTTSAIANPLPSIITSPIGGQPTVMPTAPSTPLTPLAPALAPGMKQGNIPDLKAFKRQQRMIKNRESASLSRKKKKEYVTALENNITDLQNDNQRLKEENVRLQQRVSTLETECTSLRQALGRNPSRKTTTALFALIILFSLNLGPLTGILLSSETRLNSLKTMIDANSAASSVTSGFKHRSLLWSTSDVPYSDGEAPQLPSNTSHMCPMYINATESLRLESELRDWFENKVGPSKEDKKKEVHLTAHPKTKEGRKGIENGKKLLDTKGEDRAVNEVWNALVSPPPPQPSRRNTGFYRYVHPEVLQVEASKRSKEDTSIMSTVPRWNSFLEAIQRRDDTYYVVSFSPDHLLVPATARNDSNRPRMSLLMPTLRPMNESLAPPAAHIAMMQIDCEVIHTQLVHVSEEFVPSHLRSSGSNASHPSPDPDATHRQERRNSSGRQRSRPILTKPNYPNQ